MFLKILFIIKWEWFDYFFWESVVRVCFFCCLDCLNLFMLMEMIVDKIILLFKDNVFLKF